MTINSISNMIFIGNLPPIDIDESDANAENASSLNGTYNAFEDLETVAINNFDVDNDGGIIDDEYGRGDYVTYTRDGVEYTDGPDATITYFAIVTEADGTVHNIEVLVVQMTNGDVFVGDMQNAGALDNLTIRSIELTSPNTTNAAGYYTYQSTSNTTVCFVAGTFIETPTGPRRIETLALGDMVQTMDNAPQPICWIGSMRLLAPSDQSPICIAPGALGPDQPRTELRVSPQHRIFVRSIIAERMFAEPEVLVAAKRLIGLPGVKAAHPDRSIRYWHILFRDHQIINANGAWAESLLPAVEALKTLERTASNMDLASILAIAEGSMPSRYLPTGKQQKQLIARHNKNLKPLVSVSPAPAYRSPHPPECPGNRPVHQARTQ